MGCSTSKPTLTIKPNVKLPSVQEESAIQQVKSSNRPKVHLTVFSNSSVSKSISSENSQNQDQEESQFGDEEDSVIDYMVSEDSISQVEFSKVSHNESLWDESDMKKASIPDLLKVFDLEYSEIRPKSTKVLTQLNLKYSHQQLVQDDIATQKNTPAHQASRKFGNRRETFASRVQRTLENNYQF